MNSINITLLAIFLFPLSVCAGKKSDDSLSSGNNTPPAAGQWKIIYFFDKKDETNNYSVYAVEFGSGGDLKAANDTVPYLTWKRIGSSFKKTTLLCTLSLPAVATGIRIF